VEKEENAAASQDAGSPKRKHSDTVKKEAKIDVPFSEAYICGSGADPEICATRQAWYSTMPHLDSSQAYKQNLRTEGRETKIRKLEEAQNDEANKDLEAMDAEALNRELEKAQKDFAEQDAICKEFERKIEKAEEADSKTAQQEASVNRKLTTASYKHGVIEGKIRSSEAYFNFIREDTQTAFDQKKATLTRCVNLMAGDIATMKAEVRILLQQARAAANSNSNAA